MEHQAVPRGAGKQGGTIEDLDATERVIHAWAIHALRLFRRISVNAPTDDEVFGGEGSRIGEGT